MENSAQQLEEEIYTLVFEGAVNRHRELDSTQLQKFRARLLRNVEDRLSAQFGATMALVEESFGLTSPLLTNFFLGSQEFYNYREDIDHTFEDGDRTFEQCFLNYLLRAFGENAEFCRELEEIFLLELSVGVI